MNIFKRIWRWFYLYPLKEEDLGYPIWIFAWNACTGHYGVKILKSEVDEEKMVNKGDVVVWLARYQVKLWPKEKRRASSIQVF